MNEKQRAALLIELHREIEAAADSLASTVAAKRSPSEPTYPPNGGLTGPEEAALASLDLNEHGMSAVHLGGYLVTTKSFTTWPTGSGALSF